MRSRNHCCRGKAGSITYSKRLSVTVVIQHVTRMGRIFSFVAALTFFLHYLINFTIFGGKKVI